MKDFIVMIAMLLLGVVIVKLLLSDDSSIKGASKRFMESQAENLAS